MVTLQSPASYCILPKTVCEQSMSSWNKNFGALYMPLAPYMETPSLCFNKG